MLSNIEANQASEDLSRKAKLIEIEAESKVAYNTDVVWVEISRDQQALFSKICLDYVSWDTPLSFIGTPNGNIKACVPVNHREQILNKMKQINYQDNKDLYNEKNSHHKAFDPISIVAYFLISLKLSKLI
jgi:hypothetical protein